MAEVLLIAKKSGMDLEAFWHAIRGSAGNSFLWETAGRSVNINQWMRKQQHLFSNYCQDDIHAAMANSQIH